MRDEMRILSELMRKTAGFFERIGTAICESTGVAFQFWAIVRTRRIFGYLIKM